MAVYDDLIDKTKLARFHDNLKQKGLPLNDWTTGNAYKIGYIVVHNGELYRCTVAHTANTVFDNDKFEILSSNAYSGVVITEWAGSTQYQVDDIVLANYALWRCITAHTSDVSDFSNDSANWVRITGDNITIADNQDIDDMFN